MRVVWNVAAASVAVSLLSTPSQSFAPLSTTLAPVRRPAEVHGRGQLLATRGDSLRSLAEGRVSDALDASDDDEGAVGDKLEAVLQHRYEEQARDVVEIYDTTLRDGTQGESISLSVNDKLRIAAQLSAFGVHYIEGGWPGSNPKDEEFFSRAKEELGEATFDKIVAFGSTRRKRTACEDDNQVVKLAAAGTRAVCLVGKSWDLHIDKILCVSREENLAMVSETVAYFKEREREVFLDLEHFFDGMKANSDCTLDVCQAAVDAGVDGLVLCDTNGGTLPWQINAMTAEVVARFPKVRVGVHCHNDQELAVANSLEAVRAGASLVQGTINGVGERTGNANLVSIVPTLQLKMGKLGVGEGLVELTTLSRFVDELMNRQPQASAPWVGASAFAHKGGLHVSAVNKIPDSYQHIDPALVGNTKRVLVSELSGRANIIAKAREFGFLKGEADMLSEKESKEWGARSLSVLQRVKNLESQGYTFEGAEASMALMIFRTFDTYKCPFALVDYTIVVADSHVEGNIDHMLDGPSSDVSGSGASAGGKARATVKLSVSADPRLEARGFTEAKYKDGPRQPTEVTSEQQEVARRSGKSAPSTQVLLEVAEGNGPIDALWTALRKALLPFFAALDTVELVDYKVRCLSSHMGTGATTRVMIEFSSARDPTVAELAQGIEPKLLTWTTVAADTNVISASLMALLDGLEYALVIQSANAKSI